MFKDLKRDRFGFYDLDEVSLTNLKSIEGTKRKFTFCYQGKKYFCKGLTHADEAYKELIASYIADTLLIDHTKYDLVYYNYDIASISEFFYDEDKEKFIPIEEVLKESFDLNPDDHNNIESVRKAFEKKYNDKEIVDSLMRQVMDIFMFDIIIGNVDRHTLNYGIIESKDGKKVRVTPLYDNGEMSSEYGLYYNIYSIGIDDSDSKEITEEYTIVDKFLDVGNDDDIKLFKSRLQILDIENLTRLFKKIERETGIGLNNSLVNDIFLTLLTNGQNIRRKIDKKIKQKKII